MPDQFKYALELSQTIKKEIVAQTFPPEEGFACSSQQIISLALVKYTRGYIERIANQINGCYEKGWYDACAVMIRRLIETLIIEVFESYGISSKIQNSKGDFFFLEDLIIKTLDEPSFNLCRGTKKALPKLKDVGDKSAHSRRYIAYLADIESIKADIRLVIQEFIFLAKFK